MAGFGRPRLQEAGIGGEGGQRAVAHDGVDGLLLHLQTLWWSVVAIRTRCRSCAAWARPPGRAAASRPRRRRCRRRPPRAAAPEPGGHRIRRLARQHADRQRDASARRAPAPPRRPSRAPVRGERRGRPAAGCPRRACPAGAAVPAAKGCWRGARRRGSDPGGAAGSSAWAGGSARRSRAATGLSATGRLAVPGTTPSASASAQASSSSRSRQARRTASRSRSAASAAVVEQGQHCEARCGRRRAARPAAAGWRRCRHGRACRPKPRRGGSGARARSRPVRSRRARKPRIG